MEASNRRRSAGAVPGRAGRWSRSQQPPAFGGSGPGRAQGREPGGKLELAHAFVEGTIELVADLKGQRFEGRAELVFEVTAQERARSPAQQQGEEERAPTDRERRPRAQAEAGIEDPPPVLPTGSAFGGGALHQHV